MLTINKETSVVKTFLSYSIPCIVGLFLTSSIIVIDGMFIGWKVGEKGLAAVNITLPVLYVLLAVTTTIGVGGVTLATRSLGAKDHARASYYFSYSLSAVAIITAVLSGLVYSFLDQVTVLLGADETMRPYVKEFLGVLLHFYLFIMINIIFSMFIRAEGKPQLSLVFGVAGNIINVLLDYLFIMRLEWGMSGAALASGIAVILPFLFGMGYFWRQRSVYRFSRFRASRKDFGEILLNGSAEFISQISVSITTAAFNWVLLTRMGVHGVAALTVIGYVMFIHNMIVTGIAIGIHPLISYHFGAKQTDAIWAFVKIAMQAVTGVGAVLFLVSFVAAEGIMGLFAGGNSELIMIGKLGLQCISLAFLLSGYNFIASVFFTAVGEAKRAAVISGLRSLALVLVFLAVLPYVLGDRGVWLTNPLAELITFGIAWVWVQRIRSRVCPPGSPAIEP